MKKILIGIVVLVIIGAIISGGSDEDNKQPEKQTAQTEATQTEESVTAIYEELKREESSRFDDLWIYVEDATLAEQAILQAETTCKNPCAISVYDDKKAFELDTGYTALLDSGATSDTLTAYQEENYVFIADHHPAYKSHTSETVDSYPYKDSYYDELAN